MGVEDRPPRAPAGRGQRRSLSPSALALHPAIFMLPPSVFVPPPSSVGSGPVYQQGNGSRAGGQVRPHPSLQFNRPRRPPGYEPRNARSSWPARWPSGSARGQVQACEQLRRRFTGAGVPARTRRRGKKGGACIQRTYHRRQVAGDMGPGQRVADRSADLHMLSRPRPFAA